jgi:hypothetical protein
MDIAEGYKFLGATLGIFATALALRDRNVRYRPSVSITAQHHNHGTSNVLLRVKNQAPYDIIIEKIVSSSPHYRVDSADSMLGIIHGVEGNNLRASRPQRRTIAPDTREGDCRRSGRKFKRSVPI